MNFTVMGLIVLGGIGFLTWGDVREHKWHLRAYCLQSKLVLAVTAALILLCRRCSSCSMSSGCPSGRR